MTDKIVALTTCGSADEARKVAQALVWSRLAACVNIVPGVESIYHWEGKIQDEQEWLLVIKSRRDLLPRMRELLNAQHSYDVPELVAVDVSGGSPSYLNWLDEELAAAE